MASEPAKCGMLKLVPENGQILHVHVVSEKKVQLWRVLLSD